MFKLINIKRIVVGALFGIAATAFFLFVSSVLLFFTGIPDRATELMAIVATVFGVLFGGIASSFRTNGYGWLSGGLAGIVYALILWLVSLLVLGNPDFIKLLINMAFGFVTGASGGIAGINFRSKPMRKKRRKK